MGIFRTIINKVREMDEATIFKISKLDKWKIYNHDLKMTFDRRIFLVSFIFILLICGVYLFLFGVSNHAYVKCDENGAMCLNPLLWDEKYLRENFVDLKTYIPFREQLKKDCNVLRQPCDKKFLAPGEELGIKEYSVTSKINFTIIIIFVFAFIINHFLYNRNRKINKV